MTDFHSVNLHLSQIMYWHFSPETGSPFWLEKRKSVLLFSVKLKI